MTKHLLVLMLIVCPTVLAQQKNSVSLPDSGNVSLPLDEYNKLVELASKPPKMPDIPPLSYSIKQADLKFRVENESVSGTVQLEGETFKKGVTKVPLTTGMTLFEVAQEGKGIPLGQENGIQTAIFSGPAQFSMTLTAGLVLGIEAGRASFNLPVPMAGSAQLSLMVPGEHTYVNISPGLITNRSSVKGQTVIAATLVPGQSTSVWWATREATTSVVPREVRFLSNIKTLVSVSEADIRLAALADVSVLQGEPSRFELDIPPGYEVTGASGASLESSEEQSGVLVLKVAGGTQRNHQFLISLERSLTESKANIPFLAFKGTQREIGELLVEGAGTMELTTTEGGSLKRMDVKEANPFVRSLAHFPPQAAFRYHKQPHEAPSLALEWVRFPDSSVLAAIAESAEITTMVTTEGRSLTEVKLVLKNQAQPFLKVALPTGASILSAEVAGEKVKPVQGADGNRVPLLRPGFRPLGPYTASFVFIHAGAPFARKGSSELSLPSMDVPVDLLHWEVFLPEQYKVKDFAGDVIAADHVPPAMQEGLGGGIGPGHGGGVGGGMMSTLNRPGEAVEALLPGQLGGYIVDPSGAGVPGVRITVLHPDTGTTMNAITDEAGHWILANAPSGKLRITAESPGFKTYARDLNYDAGRPSSTSFALSLGNTSETIEVMASTDGRESRRIEKEAKKQAQVAQNSASSNVINLQRRVAGVLPVAIEVPRTGTSFKFVRPLVLNEETKVTFNYRSK